MTTLAQLADLIQAQISDSDAGTWPQATVEAWVLDAIRDYSLHFPRFREDAITTVADTHEYALPDDFLDALLVEYPDGEDPPTYLTRLSRTHPGFWRSDEHYDIYTGEQVADENEALAVGFLIVSADVAAGETITLTYAAAHDDALESAGTVTVPSHHFDILSRFVVWRAWVERLGLEESRPDHTVLLLSQLASNADRAHRAYTEALNRARAVKSDAGPTGPWRSDIYDPIY